MKGNWVWTILPIPNPKTLVTGQWHFRSKICGIDLQGLQQRRPGVTSHQITHSSNAEWEVQQWNRRIEGTFGCPMDQGISGSSSFHFLFLLSLLFTGKQERPRRWSGGWRFILLDPDFLCSQSLRLKPTCLRESRRKEAFSLTWDWDFKWNGNGHFGT